MLAWNVSDSQSHDVFPFPGPVGLSQTRLAGAKERLPAKSNEHSGTASAYW
jgi:hypothetical protein